MLPRPFRAARRVPAWIPLNVHQHIDVVVRAHAQLCPWVCLHWLQQHVHKGSVVGGVPCSFLCTLWWFSSASKPQLWPTWSSWSGVTMRTLTGLLRKPRSTQSKKNAPSTFAISSVLFILTGRDTLPSILRFILIHQLNLRAALSQSYP